MDKQHENDQPDGFFGELPDEIADQLREHYRQNEPSDEQDPLQRALATLYYRQVMTDEL